MKINKGTPSHILVYTLQEDQNISIALGALHHVEEVPPNIYCISSATENIIMEVSPKIWKNICFVTLAYKGINWKYF